MLVHFSVCQDCGSVYFGAPDPTGQEHEALGWSGICAVCLARQCGFTGPATQSDLTLEVEPDA